MGLVIGREKRIRDKYHRVRPRSIRNIPFNAPARHIAPEITHPPHAPAWDESETYPFQGRLGTPLGTVFYFVILYKSAFYCLQKKA